MKILTADSKGRVVGAKSGAKYVQKVNERGDITLTRVRDGDVKVSRAIDVSDLMEVLGYRPEDARSVLALWTEEAAVDASGGFSAMSVHVERAPLNEFGHRNYGRGLEFEKVVEVIPLRLDDRMKAAVKSAYKASPPNLPGTVYGAVDPVTKDAFVEGLPDIGRVVDHMKGLGFSSDEYTITKFIPVAGGGE